MKYKRRMIISVFWVLLGAVLFFCALFNVIDQFWSGMGGGLFAVGLLQLIKHIRYIKDAEYREEVDIAVNDERHKFISGRAYAWACYIYVIGAAIAAIGFKMAGKDELALFAGISVSAIALIYAVTYLILSKKY